MMKEAVEQCGGDDGIAEDLAPFCKATIGGQDHGAALVARVDELEEQVAARCCHLLRRSPPSSCGRRGSPWERRRSPRRLPCDSAEPSACPGGGPTWPRPTGCGRAQ